MKKLVVSLAGIIALVLSGVVVVGAERTEGATKDLFEKRCGACHSIDRSTSQKKTVREWERTVLRMKNSLGARLTDQEAKAIIEYLAKNHGA
jgi:mono/diheme cytochrome c family protein